MKRKKRRAGRSLSEKAHERAAEAFLGVFTLLIVAELLFFYFSDRIGK